MADEYNSNNAEQEISSQTSEQAKSIAQNAVSGGVGRLGQSLGRKAGNATKKAAINIANKIRNKKMSEAAVKAGIQAAKLISAIVSTLSTLLLILFSVFLVIIILYLVANWIINILPSIQYTNYNSTDGSISLNEANIGTFYTEMSERSYYIMVDDSPYIYQANSQEWKNKENLDGEISDIDNREGQFALSPMFLKTLDYRLNQDYISPEQFIKPVYNTCMDNDESNDDSWCTLKQLTDENGEVVAESTYYSPRENISESTTDLSGHIDDVNYDEVKDTYYYDKNPDATTNGIWNWGLASLIHYKSFEEDSHIADYKIKTAQVWNAEERKLEPVYSFFSNTNRKDYINQYGFIEPPKEITYDTQAEEIKTLTNGLSYVVPETVTKYAIDKATTFLGSVSNSLSQSWVYHADSGGTSLINNYYYEYQTSMNEDVDESMSYERFAYAGNPVFLDYTVETYGGDSKKVSNKALGHMAINSVASGFDSVEWEPKLEEDVDNPNYAGAAACTSNGGNTSNAGNAGIGGSNSTTHYDCREKITVTVHEARYAFHYGSDVEYIEGDEGSLSFTVRYNPVISYYKEGKLETNEVRYNSPNPDLSGITGIQYLEDYIKNYKIFLTTEDENYDYRFICSVDSLSEDPTSDSPYCFDWPVSTVESSAKGSGLMYSFDAQSLPPYHQDKLGSILGLVDGENNNLAESIEAVEAVDPEITKIEAEEKQEYEDKTADVKQKFNEVVTKQARIYGVDANLVFAIIADNVDDEMQPSFDDSRNYGWMGIDLNNSSISAENFATLEADSFEIDEESAMDLTVNIKAGIMQLQNALVNNNYNIPLSLFEYKNGRDVRNAVIEIYKFKTGYTEEEIMLDNFNYEWIYFMKAACEEPEKFASVSDVKDNDEDYLRRIFSYLPANGTLTFESASSDAGYRTLKTFQINTISSVSYQGTTGAQRAQAAIKRSYRLASVNNFNNKANWNLMTLYQKDFYAGLYTNAHTPNNNSANYSTEPEDIAKNIVTKSPQTAFLYDRTGMNDTDIEVLIKTLFSAQEGINYEEYDTLSTEFWKEQFSLLFGSIGSRSWSDASRIQSLFNGNVQLPVTKYKVERNYGYNDNQFGVRTYNNAMLLSVENDTDVRAISKGVVSDVSDNPDSDYGKYVEIVHTYYDEYEDVRSDDQEEADEDTQQNQKVVVTRYIFLDDVYVSKGDEIETGQEIGLVKSKIDGYFGIQFIVDEMYNDPAEIFEYYYYWQSKLATLFGVMGSSGPQNTAMLDYLRAVLEHADEIEAGIGTFGSWDLSTLTDTSSGRKSAGTWTYPSGDRHEAMDWATPIGTPVYAMGDAIILNYHDECRDYPSGGFQDSYNAEILACDGKIWGNYGNKVTMLMKSSEGNWYSVSVWHLQNGSASPFLYDLVTSDYKNGTYTIGAGGQVASSGHSGISTGPHEHIEVVNIGSASLEEIMTVFLEGESYDSHFGVGFYSNEYGMACEQTGAAPCRERPDIIFSY